MTNHELLDMIGDVKEEYVEEADGSVIRPRFRWKALAGLAACAALALGAYPLYRAVNPPLHGYDVMGSSAVLTDELLQAPVGGSTEGPAADSDTDEAPPVLSAPAAPEAAPAEPEDGAVSSNRAGKESLNDAGAGGMDGGQTWAAIAQYQGLLRGLSGREGWEPETYPDWYGGVWVDDAGDRLAVAIVDGFHTGELEAQIEEWCGGEVVFVPDMKYSYAHLLSLYDQILQASQEHINQDDVWSTLTYFNPDMMANRLDVGFSGAPSDAALAFLARLDPEGDAIRVQVYAQAPDLAEEEQPAPALSAPGGAGE